MNTIHGGDLDYAVRRYGLKRNEIRDYSGNINPFGIPKRAKEAIIKNVSLVSTYPDKNYLSLRESIAKYLNVSAQSIIVGNGGTELISLFIRASLAKKALVVAPVYSEYEREITLNGGECVYYALDEKSSFNADIADLCANITDEIDLLALCNPNNPTGTAIKKADMETIALECAKNNVRLLIDETYCEFSNEEIYSSVFLAEKYDNVIVIRGISKFFAAPGLRLGYAVCKDVISGEIYKIKDPWSVNTLAAIAAEEFFADAEFISKTKAFIHMERERIYQELSNIKSIRAYKSEANFQLFKLLNSAITSGGIFERLITKGMMIRDAKSFKFLDDTFIRFCFLTKEDNDKILIELKELLE